MNEAVSGVAPFGLADFRAGMAEVRGRRGLPSVEGPSGAVLPPKRPPVGDPVAGELKELAAPRGVHFVTGPPMAVKDKIGKRALRARYRDS
jgi:hypothetical protein